MHATPAPVQLLPKLFFALALLLGCNDASGAGGAAGTGGTSGTGGTGNVSGGKDGSICGSERPCLPEGTWIVSYETPASGQGFGSNTIRIGADAVEVLGESAPDDTCSLGPPTPGRLNTSAELSNDGCTLTAEISKSWCSSGEGQCEDRNITLDFCANGSTTVATGSLEACRCWADGNSPACGAGANLRPVDATATRMEP